MQTLAKNWWLLPVSGVLDAVISVIYFNHAGHGFHSMSDVFFLGSITIAAGACMIVAGLWPNNKGRTWPLVLSGVTLGVLGLFFDGVFGLRIRFSTVASLIILMAMGLGALYFAAARTLWRGSRVGPALLFATAAIGSVIFACAFFALGFGWVKVEPGSFKDVVWLGCYFAFCAACMLVSGLPLAGLRPATDPSPAAPNDSASRSISLRNRATSALVSVR